MVASSVSTLSTILLVEDNPDDELLTLEALRDGDLLNPIVVARDGVEALDYLLGTGFSSRALHPAVVLLDLKLPKLDGLEVLKRVRAHEELHHVPVVVLTSSDEDRDITDSYRFGANSYIRKPVDSDHFMHAVRQLGLYWVLLNLRAPR